MNIKKTILGACVFSLGIAAAASNSHVKIYDPTWVGQTELKPGEYNVSVEGDKVTFKQGKKVIAFSAKVETNASTFINTQLNSTNANGHSTLNELDLGGTKYKIMLTDAASAEATGTH